MSADETEIKVGDLVKRSSLMAWYTAPYDRVADVGLVVNTTSAQPAGLDFEVMWSSGKVYWHEAEDLTVVNS